MERCEGVVASVAALKLGASSAIGVDNDPVACENALETALLNGVGKEFMERR